MERQRSAREQHRAAVLSLLHRGHPLTRSEISDSLGLTRSTVSEVLASLRSDGILAVSSPRPPGGRGRPAEVLRIHPGAARYVGLDFTHTTVTACLANSAAEIVASGCASYDHEAGWESRVRRGVALVRSLATDEVHLGPLAGIGIGLPGPNSASWQGFQRIDGPTEPFHLVRARIREVFGEEFSAPVVVDHHIRFAALQEAAAAGGVDRSLIYLRLSTGAGGAVLSGRRALRGSHLLAGEIGHMTVDRSESAQPCRCGRRGCLETVASKDAVLARWRALSEEKADLHHLHAALEAGDQTAQDLVTEIARTVGHVLGVTALVMDPDQIVVAGEVGALLTTALPTLQSVVAQETLTAGELSIRIATVDAEQGARGAITALRANDHVPDLEPDIGTRPVGNFDTAGGTSVR
ncbi:ROK family transcriptional regulator [Brachybacterium alimentarium]|uniref:ROK family transcriptional regulator n=1 Tax=Brachybacterium alimentarium TaxID=47845 RepID=UPI003FD0BB8F